MTHKTSRYARVRDRVRTYLSIKIDSLELPPDVCMCVRVRVLLVL